MSMTVVAIAAFLASAALTACLRPVARRLGAVARPKEDRWNRRTIPLLGGIAIWAVTSVGSASLGGGGAHLWALLGAGTAAFLIGVVDDFVPLKPSTKLTAQIAIGCFSVFCGIAGAWTGSPVLDAVISVAWVVAITNGFNLLDNMDGLCAGIALIAAVALAIIVHDRESAAFVPSVILAAALGGFLLFNFSPASIFMGDGGSLFIGTMLSLLALAGESSTRNSVFAALVVPVLLLLVPIFDTGFVTVARKLSRRPASVGGKDHTSHRLVMMGFSEAQSVLLLYSLAAGAAATAVLISRLAIPESQLVLFGLLIGLALLGVQLARVRAYGEDDFSALRGHRYTPLLVNVTYKRRIFEVLLDSGLILVAYYAAYILRFDTQFPEYYPYFVRSVPIVLASQIVSFFLAGVYRGVWKHFGVSDLLTYIKGVLLGILTSIMVLLYLYRFEGYSRVVFFIDGMALLILVLGSRASLRVFRDLASRQRGGGRPTLIYGAGDGGMLLLRELRNNQEYGLDPVGFLDDDLASQTKRVGGLMVLGRVENAAEQIARRDVQVVVISTEKILPHRRAEILRVCATRGIELLQFTFSLEPVLATRVEPRGVGIGPER